MHYMLVLVLLVASLAPCQSRSVNYCGAKMCGHSNSHTFCQYPVGPSPNCVGYLESKLSAEEKARITARLNRRRNEVAAGRLRRLPPAGNMLKLRWVEELAREAERWADQCRPPQTPDEYDNCRDLYSTTVGQCVGSVVGEAPGLRAESMVDVWYMQSMFYKGNVTSYTAPTYNTSYYGDFAQIIWSRAYMVGCGRSRFMISRNGRMRSVERLVCNFAPRGPIPGRPLWIVAAPATACMPRSLPDDEFPALCNYQHFLDERQDVTNTMALEEHALLNSVFEVEINEQLNYQGSVDELYLTKMAIATMDNSISSATYNLVHKRDIFEIITLSVSNNVHRITLDNTYKELLNKTNTIPFVDQTTSTVALKKKINLIGRPKPYNMDDLSDNVQTSTNTRAIVDDLPKSTREFYAEYEYLDSSENNLTATYGNTNNLNEITPEITENTYGINHTTTDMIRLSNVNATDDYVGAQIGETNANTFILRNTIKSELVGYNSSNAISNESLALIVNKEGNDYFNDPETVQQLQEALERMERSLETSTAGKVRRELGDFPLPHQSFSPQPEKNKRKLHEENNTLDKAPMLNMVLRYMPYLKPYEKEILGNVMSRSYIHSPSIVLVLLYMYILYFNIIIV